MKTQFERILAHLRKQRSGATVHDLILVSGGNSPWKRIEERTDGLGNVIGERKGPWEWTTTGERIVREYARHNGRDMTVYRLVKA